MPFGVDETRAAVIAIDLHRGHLDPGVATMPVPSGVERQVIEANRQFFDRCREVEIPIVHLVTKYRDVSEIRTNPFWRTRADDPDATRKNVERHNIEGSPGCEIIPVLWDKDRDWVVDTKKRYNCFVATDLDFLLRKHGINTVLITGGEHEQLRPLHGDDCLQPGLRGLRGGGLRRYHGRPGAARGSHQVYPSGLRLGYDER
jgi:biuret amidohydrolase